MVLPYDVQRYQIMFFLFSCLFLVTDVKLPSTKKLPNTNSSRIAMFCSGLERKLAIDLSSNDHELIQTLNLITKHWQLTDPGAVVFGNAVECQ